MTKLKAAADEQSKLRLEEQEKQFNDALSKLQALVAKNKNSG